MKRFIIAVAAIASLASGAHATPRQFNLECDGRDLANPGTPPIHQVTAIDLDRSLGWNVGATMTFNVLVTEASLDLGIDDPRVSNTVNRLNGTWIYRFGRSILMGTCKIAPYTPMPAKAF